MRLTYEDVQKDEAIKCYIQKADESLLALGYTEHSFPHVCKVASEAQKILTTLGYDEREAELAAIAGYLHDIGNVVNRVEHAQSGAVMAFRILDRLNAAPDEIATIITAIGNHDESTAFPVNPVAAALILADKTDVRRSRVRNQDISTFDIHDRVNYSVTRSGLNVDSEKRGLTLNLEVDTAVSPVMEYFEIFMKRMLMCAKAAEKLGLRFELIINGLKMFG